MSVFIDRKYVGLVSSKLPLYNQKSTIPFLANFRCVYCGDSQKKATKRRGYLYEKKGNIFYHCKNCGTGTSMGNLLKKLDPVLYREYNLENYKEGNNKNFPTDIDISVTQENKPVTPQKIYSLNLPTIESLPKNHPAKYYLQGRKIPQEFFSQLYYADNFKAFIGEIKPDYDKKLYSDRRIVIPFWMKDGDKHYLGGVSGRSLDENSSLRYIAIKVFEDSPKIFGLDRIDPSKTIYVVEGQIDSMFLENCIAATDSALYNVIASIPNGNFIFVYDNEPRNKEIVSMMQKTIDLGQKICIWPKYVIEKDINAMILAGQTKSEIQAIIDANVYEGLEAKLMLELWRK